MRPAAETLEKLKCLCRVEVIELSGGSHNSDGGPKGQDYDRLHETWGQKLHLNCFSERRVTPTATRFCFCTNSSADEVKH